MQTSQDAPRLLAPAVVVERTSLSWDTIHRKIRAREFPQPVKISTQRIAFRESDVNDWINSRQPAAA